MGLAIPNTKGLMVANIELVSVGATQQTPFAEEIKLEAKPITGIQIGSQKHLSSQNGQNEDITDLILKKAEEWEYHNTALVFEIIRRESGFNPEECNKEFGCSSGQGLFQIIPGTHRYCEQKLGRTLDVFNPEDNLDCGLWLLKYEGIRHWDPYSGPY